MPWSDNTPLSGIKVLDLTRVVSGPFATMQLGDLGADVVKVEQPGIGDESRGFGPPFQGGESAYYLSVNRNKRGCAIDLKSAAGKELVLLLAGVADVVVVNFRPGTLERLGIGYEALSQNNARLILCSITGFGQSGPDADRPAYDLIVQGEAGLMDITGEADGLPTKVGIPIADLATALYSTQAILAALLRRQQTGLGGRVDVSMLDSLASLLAFNSGVYFATGQSPKRHGSAHPTICPYEPFQAQDGWINVGVTNDKFWKLFCDVIKCPELLADPRFAGAPDRVINRVALKEILEPIIREKPRQHWQTVLKRAGVPFGEIKSVGEVCETPQLVERGVVRTVAHPQAGQLKYISSAIRFDDQPPPGATRPPLIGEHNHEVLGDWLGLDKSVIDGYARDGAFGVRELENKDG